MVGSVPGRVINWVARTLASIGFQSRSTDVRKSVTISTF